MGREYYEAFDLLKHERNERRAQQRAASNEQFEAARQLAEAAGLTLVRHTDAHYSLRSPEGWLLNLYPGPSRIVRDANKPPAPWVRVRHGWTLLEVVEAVVVERRDVR